MSNVSNGTPCASDSASGAALLVLEAIATNSSVAFANLLEVFAAGSWPISKAALLFAAVKLGRSTIAEQLLARGAPASFVVAKLPAADHVALNSAGISADGVGHLSPLTISVRQQNLETTRLLLRHGAPPLARVAGLPLLLHFHEAVMATASFGRPSGQLAPLSRAASLTVSGGDGGVTSGMGAGSQGDGICGNGSDMTSMMQELDERLQLLLELLQGGADPLQTTDDGQACFLSVCTQPAMLRLSVNFVRQQCERGRQLSDADAQQLVNAAGRAFFSGF